MATKRRSTRQATSRRAERSIYVDPDTDEDELEVEDDSEPQQQQQSSRQPAPKRRKIEIRARPQTRTSSSAKGKSIYVDPDTDDDFENEDSELEAQRQPAHRSLQSRRKTATRARPQTHSKSSAKGKSAVRPHSKVIGRKRKPNTLHEAPKHKEYTGPSDHKIPAWTSLPIEILREIFSYAAHPMHGNTRTESGNVDWLIKAALTCRAFAMPALEAYYLSPSLLNNLQPHHLLELLQMPKDKRYMDYNVKVKSLQIDVRRLAYTAHGKHLLNLSTLVAELPQLQHLEVLHPIDEPPFRPLKIQPWRYPEDLLPTLDALGRRLKSWRWNRDMVPRVASELYAFMTQSHSSKAFEWVERLTFCGFDYNDSAEPSASEDNSGVTAPGLTASLRLLPHLNDLTFISCEVVVDKFLERLPKDLRRLELTNCLELTSDMLQAYLASGGSQLCELVLNHNPALSLAFLPRLKELCPKLEVLKMDLHYYSERVNSNDAEPLYDELLSADDMPTWPTSLQHLELIHLQRWSAEAAQNLFRSLVDGAAELPDLRYLVLQAHINIPWRDRAGFRDQWIDRLQRVYFRQSEPPNPHLGSLRQFRLWKQAQAAGRSIAPDADHIGGAESDDVPKRSRMVVDVEISPRKPHNGDTDVYSDSSPDKGRPMRRSRRVAEVQASAASQSASPPADVSDSDDVDEDDWRRQPEKHIQGLCTVVDISIDNQRPRENQFREEDFLDSEASGDDDWQEGADVDDEEGYAW